MCVKSSPYVCCTHLSVAVSILLSAQALQFSYQCAQAPRPFDTAGKGYVRSVFGLCPAISLRLGANEGRVESRDAGPEAREAEGHKRKTPGGQLSPSVRLAARAHVVTFVSHPNSWGVEHRR
jgi:hypothetical protein